MAKSTDSNTPKFRVIGTRPIRPDGFDKVTGAAKFGADYYLPGMLHGKVLRVFPYEGYGFIDMSDGREVYFHRNSVVDGDFDRLAAGMEVRFSEEAGEQGPQASTVSLVHRSHQRKRAKVAGGRRPRRAPAEQTVTAQQEAT